MNFSRARSLHTVSQRRLCNPKSTMQKYLIVDTSFLTLSISFIYTDVHICRVKVYYSQHYILELIRGAEKRNVRAWL